MSPLKTSKPSHVRNDVIRRRKGISYPFHIFKMLSTLLVERFEFLYFVVVFDLFFLYLCASLVLRELICILYGLLHSALFAMCFLFFLLRKAYIFYLGFRFICYFVIFFLKIHSLDLLLCVIFVISLFYVCGHKRSHKPSGRRVFTLFSVQYCKEFVSVQVHMLHK